MALVATFILVGLLACGGLTRSVDRDNGILTVMSGTLYALEPLSGQVQYRLNRRHIGAMNKSSVYSLRLDLGSDVEPMDLQLSQESAWTEDAVVVERYGEELKEIHGAVDSSCYLSGRLISHNGVASFNRCGRLSGSIETATHLYEIDEAEEENLDSEMSKVKVVMRRSSGINAEADAIMFSAREEHVAKRQTIDGKTVVVENAVYLDSYYIYHQRLIRVLLTSAELTDFIIQKYNKMRQVWGSTSNVGFQFDLQLKRVELWRENPPAYERLGRYSRTLEYLRYVCRNTSAIPNYDHKMLYSWHTGDHESGVAFFNTICFPEAKCSLVKDEVNDVKVELHEFGHVLGLDHDDVIENCTDTTGDGGFMGWGQNYHFMDCYRRVLQVNMRQRHASCVFERNVFSPVLNGKEELFPSSTSSRRCRRKKRSTRIRAKQ